LSKNTSKHPVRASKTSQKIGGGGGGGVLKLKHTANHNN